MGKVEQIGQCTLAWIYALCDPDTRQPRYIGKTVGFMCDRHKAHIREARAGSRLPVHAWMRGVMEAGKPSVIMALERTGGDWAEAERKWIAAYRASGGDLLNMTDGGEGLAGHVPTAQHRERIAARLRTGSTFQCEKCGTAFWRKRNEIDKGNCRFCSKRCYQKSLVGKSKPVPALCTQRGIEAAAAEKLSRLHCKRGHMLSGDNLFRTSRGARGCKQCRKIHKIRYRSRTNG